MSREDVLIHLRIMHTWATFSLEKKQNFFTSNHMKNIAQWTEDALALLKEQGAKTGTWQWKIHGRAESGGTLGEAICDQCGKSTYATAVKGDLNYCPNCGARMEE